AVNLKIPQIIWISASALSTPITRSKTPPRLRASAPLREALRVRMGESGAASTFPFHPRSRRSGLRRKDRGDRLDPDAEDGLGDRVQLFRSPLKMIGPMDMRR